MPHTDWDRDKWSRQRVGKYRTALWVRRLPKDVTEGREVGDATTLADNTVMAQIALIQGRSVMSPAQTPDGMSVSSVQPESRHVGA